MHGLNECAIIARSCNELYPFYCTEFPVFLLLIYKQLFAIMLLRTKTKEGTNMEREYKESKILERMKKIKELSDVIIDILYGILFG